MDITTAERRLVAFLGATLNLTVDQEIFRGPPPPGVRDVFQAEFSSGVPAGRNTVNEFTAVVRGADFDRVALWEHFNALFAALPVGNVDGFLHIAVNGKVKLSREELDGLPLYTGVLELAAAFA